MHTDIEPYAGCDAAARYLIAARHSGTAGPRLPLDFRPQTLGQALAVQQRTAELLRAEHQDGVAAWKSSLPTPEKIAAAPIYASTLSRAGGAPIRARAIQPGSRMVRIEPEIAFELVRDLPARPDPYSENDIDAALGSARLALEILGCRYALPEHASQPELLADHMFNQGLVLGAALPAIDDAPACMLITTHIPHQQSEQHEGIHPNGCPKAGLYWLANFLRSQGLGLQAGQHVITGSYAGFLDVPADCELRLEFGGLGSMTLQFRLE